MLPEAEGDVEPGKVFRLDTSNRLQSRIEIPYEGLHALLPPLRVNIFQVHAPLGKALEKQLLSIQKCLIRAYIDKVWFKLVGLYKIKRHYLREGLIVL